MELDCGIRCSFGNSGQEKAIEGSAKCGSGNLLPLVLLTNLETFFYYLKGRKRPLFVNTDISWAIHIHLYTVVVRSGPRLQLMSLFSVTELGLSPSTEDSPSKK